MLKVSDVRINVVLVLFCCPPVPPPPVVTPWLRETERKQGLPSILCILVWPPARHTVRPYDAHAVSHLQGAANSWFCLEVYILVIRSAHIFLLPEGKWCSPPERFQGRPDLCAITAASPERIFLRLEGQTVDALGKGRLGFSYREVGTGRVTAVSDWMSGRMRLSCPCHEPVSSSAVLIETR